MDDLDEAHRFSVVLQRFAHTHHHDVGQRPTAVPRLANGEDNLSHHFPSAQVPGQSHQSGGTEGAANRTPHLAGNADGGPVRIEHQHRLQELAVAGAEEHLDCLPVVRGQCTDGSLEPDRLIGGESPVAERVAVHQTRLVNGRREMYLLAHGLAIPPQTTLVLEPGSNHLMLVGLRQDLVQGQTFPMTLAFSRAGEVMVTARVRRKVDAAGIAPIPPVVAGELTISLISAPPAHPFTLATPAG